ncbi:PQQ-binding-like beta-propeller repeat protein [Dyadobacter sp. CY312]|uniref:outer membrane protein assembly factor BamB family protein n=1 Tax=Dyadobacter sp. CY312 TaxID=2907303 RepID=UPI001F1B5D41|nr:PQQ-binding-like beta-propeller repeat protein [Dyadobacter sp. CY312]MCE7040301.1 PQQ-binding-like beta-propeller repeat protein [Dyadobacter sp. CY312]
MTTSEKIVIDEGFCYPSFPILDNGDVFVCLRFTEPDLSEHICKYSEIRLINIETKIVKWNCSLKDEGDYVTSKPILHKNKYYITTNNYIIALNKNDGSIVWQIKYKLWITNINIIDDLIYLCNDKEIKVINCENGKTIKSKKYRVKWLDSKVVKHNNRLFVSTSNSKIIEVNIDTLEIENEFKYSGGWAIASTPIFTNNLMLSNSYASYASCFDLTTNETLWRTNKQVGAEPKQLLDEDNQLFFIVEILQVYRLSAITIKNGKKLWTQEYHIQDLKNLNDKSIIGLLKNKNGQYFIGIINKRDGIIEKEICSTKYNFDKRFEYRLWKGAEICVYKEKIIITYSPNEIFIIMNKNNIT